MPNTPPLPIRSFDGPSRHGKKKLDASALDILKPKHSNVIDLRKKTPVAPPPAPRATRAPQPWKRAAIFFAFAALLVVPLTLKGVWHKAHSVSGSVKGASTDALSALQQAASALGSFDIALATTKLTDAAASFRSAESSIGKVGAIAGVLSTVIPAAAQVKTGEALLTTGAEIADAGQHLTVAVAPFMDQGASPTVSAILSGFASELPRAAASLARAEKASRKIRLKDVPEQYRDAVGTLTNALPLLVTDMNRMVNATTVARALLGVDRPTKFLVLFQNNFELRPTGGFLGSLAIVDIANGEVKKLDVPGGGAYDFQGQLSEKVVSPEPLHIVNPLWQLQDANWWPDFPTSAKKIMWFYEKSGGTSVDGVLAITPTLFVRLLEATGPIDLTEKYGVVITSENMMRETLLAIQSKHDDPKPKQIIADLVPLVLDRLFSGDANAKLAALAAFDGALREKDLQLYETDRATQEALAQLGWDGAVLPAERDALMVVDTNIGGGKTDGVIDELIEHHAIIDSDGSVEVTVNVTRTHHGTADDPLTGVRNVDFVRFYVPKGSVFVRADGFERMDPKRFQVPDADATVDRDLVDVEGRATIDELTGTRTSEEFGRTVFANWLGVSPGESVTASLTYRLPFTVRPGRLFGSRSASYTVLFQRQAGALGRFVRSTVSYPTSWTVTYAAPEASIMRHDHSVEFTAPLTADTLFGLELEKR